MFEKITFSPTKNLKWFVLLSLILSLAGLIAIVSAPFGLNLFNMDIDFTGGTTMHVALHTQFDQNISKEVSGIVKEATGMEPSSIQKTGDGSEIVIKVKELSSELREKVFEGLKAKYSLSDEDLLQSDNVSAAVGNDLKTKAFLASLLAAVLMMVYITFRFEFKSGLAAVICLINDLLIMMSIYVIFQIPLNMNFIAACLTILGYSINACIVVFDRIRENSKLVRREGFDQVVDRSIWQTMMRTINTNLTTLLTITMVLIFGVTSLKNFAIPLIIGIISGAYSSSMLAGPLWAYFRRTMKKA